MPLITGTDESDVLQGADFNDTINAGAGIDQVWGAAGNDVINGEGDDDYLYADDGDDTLDGGDGDDALTGGNGNDSLVGGNGNDGFDGGADNDVLIGGAGNDALNGGAGDDTYNGGTGDDTFYLGSDNGQSGNDTVLYALGDGRDALHVHVDDGGDVLQFGVGITAADVQLVQFGGDQLTLRINDTDMIDLPNWLTHNDYRIDSIRFADNTLWTPEAMLGMKRTVVSTDGNDTLHGGTGNDTLNGGAGTDHLHGDAGSDCFLFNLAPGDTAGADLVFSFESGIDTMQLDDAVFAGLTSGGLSADVFVLGDSALDGNDRIVFDAASGSLYYDADGNGISSNSTLIAVLDGGAQITAADILVV